MKITAFNGSPWGRESQTNIIAQEFLEGVRDAGASCRCVHLVEKEIKLCVKCGHCFYKTPGKCSLKDDMSDLIKRLVASDIVIFATPVYIDNVTALIKIFIERLTPTLEPHLERDSHGEYRRGKRYNKYPKFVVIASCAMPEQSNFQVLQMFFHRMARTMHTEIVGEIYRSHAGLLLLSKDELGFRPAVNEYKKFLRHVGKEFVKYGSISADTTEQLEQPMIDTEKYIEYINGIWDQLLPKHGLKIFG